VASAATFAVFVLTQAVVATVVAVAMMTATPMQTVADSLRGTGPSPSVTLASGGRVAVAECTVGPRVAATGEVFPGPCRSMGSEKSAMKRFHIDISNRVCRKDISITFACQRNRITVYLRRGIAQRGGGVVGGRSCAADKIGMKWRKCGDFIGISASIAWKGGK
jgi:hypothetical protein